MTIQSGSRNSRLPRKTNSHRHSPERNFRSEDHTPPHKHGPVPSHNTAQNPNPLPERRQGRRSPCGLLVEALPQQVTCSGRNVPLHLLCMHLPSVARAMHGRLSMATCTGICIHQPGVAGSYMPYPNLSTASFQTSPRRRGRYRRVHAGKHCNSPGQGSAQAGHLHGGLGHVLARRGNKLMISCGL